MLLATMSSANITERSGVNAVVRYSFMETLCQLFHLHGTILCVLCVNLRIRYSNFYVSLYGVHSPILTGWLNPKKFMLQQQTVPD